MRYHRHNLPFDRLIDVSFWNGPIVWEETVTEYQCVMIRSTIGVNSDLNLDENATGALSVGMKVGFYHVFTPTTNSISQANHLLEMMRKYGVTWCAIDVEIPGELLLPKLQVLLDVLRNQGVTPLIYTGAWFWDAHIGKFPSENYEWWLADYSGTPTPTLPHGVTSYLIHQYANNGKVAGIDSKVDLNRLNHDLRE